MVVLFCSFASRFLLILFGVAVAMTCYSVRNDLIGLAMADLMD